MPDYAHMLRTIAWTKFAERQESKIIDNFSTILAFARPSNRSQIMKHIVLLFAILLLGAVGLQAQESRLAQQYYQDGEYEKAATLYSKLWEESKNDFFFDRYVECLLSLERYEECEAIVKKEIKRQPKELSHYVTYGNVLERQYKDAEAEEQYKLAIKNLTPDQFSIIKLANAFTNLSKWDLAIETYERGAKLLNNNLIFAYNLGNLYQQKGEISKMIDAYLSSLSENPARMPSIQSVFQRGLQIEDLTELQSQLYTRIQENQNAPELVEMLIWTCLQTKDYKNALRQARALDKRLNENGIRVYNIAQIAANDHDYDAAIAAYDYLVNEKGNTSPFYVDAKRRSLWCARTKLISGFNYTSEELRALEAQYEKFLNEFGKNQVTALIQVELAVLEGQYLNDLDRAIANLQEVVALPATIPGFATSVQAEAKLKLGDFYLIRGEVWEATLLYSQVDKAIPDDILGHEARYRNAKLSYYNGDFQWAQAQFGVLKASTSKLIANDALDLSVFITDNLGLDSTPVALMMYAEADLLVFQNRFEDANRKLDSLVTLFPEHSLEDDVYYLEAKIFGKKKDYARAAERYNRIIEKYPEEIRADNALFELAELYENPNYLNNPDKAKELFEKIFIDYSNSTFAVEARKRFRQLRGDKIQ
jgi:tetratricopeptide (TPR) repeat protein